MIVVSGAFKAVLNETILNWSSLSASVFNVKSTAIRKQFENSNLSP